MKRAIFIITTKSLTGVMMLLFISLTKCFMLLCSLFTRKKFINPLKSDLH